MARRRGVHGVETRGDRAALAESAGMGRVSLASVLAGTLVAYGAFAVLMAVTAAVAKSVGFDTDLSTNEWRDLGVAGGAVVAAVLFLCYLFGGYVAGRMARRAGATNGLMVFVLGVLVAVGVTGLVNVFTDGDDILRNLRSVGVPTSAEEWGDVGTVAGLGSLLAMLVGSVLGGSMGERWHAKLLARAADPSVGPEAEARAEADLHRRQLRDAEERARQRRLDGTSTSGTSPAAVVDDHPDGDWDGSERRAGTAADRRLRDDDLDGRTADDRHLGDDHRDGDDRHLDGDGTVRRRGRTGSGLR